MSTRTRRKKTAVPDTDIPNLPFSFIRTAMQHAMSTRAPGLAILARNPAVKAEMEATVDGQTEHEYEQLPSTRRGIIGVAAEIVEEFLPNQVCTVFYPLHSNGQ